VSSFCNHFPVDYNTYYADKKGIHLFELPVSDKKTAELKDTASVTDCNRTTSWIWDYFIPPALFFI